MTQRRAPVWLWPLLAFPLFMCGCCSFASFGAAIPPILGHVPLILGGSHAYGTISAIIPCPSTLLLSADTTGTRGWHFAQGDLASDAVQVQVTYQDAQGGSHTGQTLLCTTAPAAATVGSSIAIIYRDQDLLLARDHGAYRQFAAIAGVSVACLLAYLLLVVVVIVRQRVAYLNPKIVGSLSPSLFDPALDVRRARIKELSDVAIGTPTTPTPGIGLKEALMLVHLRQTEATPPDEPNILANRIALRDHLVLAAMLVDLVRQGRIDVVRGGLFGRPFIVVRDSSPLIDPDLSTLLATLQGVHGRIYLFRFYTRYSRNHLAARLIDQLRQGGYVRVHVPQTGRYAIERPLASSPIGQWVTQFLGAINFDKGLVVATDDYRLALPWQFLYTTHTDAEEAIFAQLQGAIANGGAVDDFTQALLGLITAHYISWNLFPRKYRAAKSIYRFYPFEERRAINKLSVKMVQATPASWRAIFRIARNVDSQIENPSSE